MTSPVKNGDNNTEKTEIAYGIENTIKMTIKCFSIVRNKSDICSDYKGPIIFVGTEPVWNAYKNMKNRGVKIRFVTEIRKDNVIYCKKLSEVGEIRHLEGVNGNFAVLDESEYYAPAISQNYAPAVPILLHVSIRDFVSA